MAGGAGTGGIGDDDIAWERGNHAIKMGIGIGVGVLAFVIILVHILHHWGTKRAERQNDDEVVAPFARRALPRNVMPSPYAPSQRSQLGVGGATANVNRLQPPSSKAVAATVDDDIPPPDYSHFVNNGVRRANSETSTV